MNDPAASPSRPHALARSFARSLALPRHPRHPSPCLSLSPKVFSRSPLLLSSALGGRRVAILALGLFVKQTTELTPSPSRTPLCEASLSSRSLYVSAGVCFN